MNHDRKTLIRLASSLPKGSEKRKAILAELQKESGLWLFGMADPSQGGIDVRLTISPTVRSAKKLNDRILDQVYKAVENAVKKVTGKGLGAVTWPPDMDSLEFLDLTNDGLRINLPFIEIEFDDGSYPTSRELSAIARKIG